jgi:hypothetical protein
MKEEDPPFQKPNLKRCGTPEKDKVKIVLLRCGCPTRQEVLGYYLKHEVRFIEAVKPGIATAERGEFVEHDEVLARIDGLFQQ